MARYRTYKNGITGHRYKGFYIIKGEKKGSYAIWDENKEIITDHVYDFEDCEWLIDKKTCSKEDLEIIEKLYDMEIFQLSAMFVDLMNKREQRGSLDPDDARLYEWCQKVRSRKTKDRAY